MQYVVLKKVWCSEEETKTHGPYSNRVIAIQKVRDILKKYMEKSDRIGWIDANTACVFAPYSDDALDIYCVISEVKHEAMSVDNETPENSEPSDKTLEDWREADDYRHEDEDR